MPTCIWCLTKDAEPSIEHIIPEALGCPEGFVLTGGIVCQNCNNDLAHLDRAVIDDFDLLAYWANVPRKRGRPAMVRGRGNLVATRRRRGPEISINMDPKTTVADDGRPLGALGKSDRNVRASLKRDGNIGTVSFSIVIGKNPKFRRGITKIGLSCLAHFFGADVAVENRFDPVRAFVRDGVGHRPILMMAGEDPAYRNSAWPPYRSEETGEYCVAFRIAMAEFLVDLSPGLTSSARFIPELERAGTQGWTWI